MAQTYKIQIVSLISIVILMFSSCIREGGYQDDISITSSLEKVSKNGKLFLADSNNAYTFRGGDLQTEIEQRSGKYSVMTFPKNAFSLSVEIPKIKRDSYIEASVWRKGTAGQLVAVITGSNDYFAAKEPTETDSNGWEKLSLKFYVIPTKEYQKIKFYIWNPGKDTVFFDDISIQIVNERKFPVFNEENISY